MQRTVSLSLALAKEQNSCFPAAPELLLLLPHSQAKREQNMFFFSFLLSAPKIKKNDMDVIIPSVTVPAEQEKDTKA